MDWKRIFEQFNGKALVPPPKKKRKPLNFTFLPSGFSQKSEWSYREIAATAKCYENTTGEELRQTCAAEGAAGSVFFHLAIKLHRDAVKGLNNVK